MGEEHADRALRRKIDDALVLYRLRRLTLAVRGARAWFRQAAFVRTLATVALVLGLAVVIEWLTTGSWGWPSWTALGLTLVVLLAIGLVGAATIAQRRIVIESFADHAHPSDKVDPAVAGLPALIRAELNRLRQLYDPPSRRVGLEVIGLGPDYVGGQASMLLDVTGGDMTETLRTAVTADSKVTVGFLSVPVAPALVLLERVLQGPRVAGSLHRDGDELVLAAQLRRRGGQRTWLLRQASSDESHAVEELARRLAGVVTAHLLHGPTLGEQAIEHFHAGLQCYADAERQPAWRLVNLRRARDCFLDAAANDPAFGWASFNLGLVYRELAVDTSDNSLYSGAEQCFDRAIQTDPRRWEFRHARCVVARDQADIREGIQHAEAALGLARNAMAKAKSAHQLGGLWSWGERSGAANELRMRRRAAAWARRALLAADLRDRDDADPAATAASTLLSLGIASAYRALGSSGPARQHWTNKARDALSLAAGLRPDDANVPFQLARVEEALGEPARVQAAARRATAIDQDHLGAWVCTAMAASKLGDAVELSRSLQAILWSPCRALATPARDGPPALLELTEAWRAQWPGLPPPNIPLRYLEEVRARWTELDRLDEAQLEARIKAPLARDAFAPDLSGWEQAMAHVRLAHPSFRPPDSTDADEWARVADRLESAVVLLERDHVSDIIYLGLRPSIAHLRRRANRLGSVDGAKMFATRATCSSPPPRKRPSMPPPTSSSGWSKSISTTQPPPRTPSEPPSTAGPRATWPAGPGPRHCRTSRWPPAREGPTSSAGWPASCSRERTGLMRASGPRCAPRRSSCSPRRRPTRTPSRRLGGSGSASA